jgi:hypothetical protein
VQRARDGGTLVRCEVIGKAIIMHVDGSEVVKGGIVELNTEETDVQMLIDLGYVKPAPVAGKAGTAANG